MFSHTLTDAPLHTDTTSAQYPCTRTLRPQPQPQPHRLAANSCTLGHRQSRGSLRRTLRGNIITDSQTIATPSHRDIATWITAMGTPFERRQPYAQTQTHPPSQATGTEPQVLTDNNGTLGYRRQTHTSTLRRLSMPFSNNLQGLRPADNNHTFGCIPHRQHSQMHTIIHHSQTCVLPNSLQKHSQTLLACSDTDALTDSFPEHTIAHLLTHTRPPLLLVLPVLGLSGWLISEDCPSGCHLHAHSTHPQRCL